VFNYNKIFSYSRNILKSQSLDFRLKFINNAIVWKSSWARESYIKHFVNLLLNNHLYTQKDGNRQKYSHRKLNYKITSVELHVTSTIIITFLYISRDKRTAICLNIQVYLRSRYKEHLSALDITPEYMKWNHVTWRVILGSSKNT